MSSVTRNVSSVTWNVSSVVLNASSVITKGFFFLTTKYETFFLFGLFYIQCLYINTIVSWFKCTSISVPVQNVLFVSVLFFTLKTM